MSTWTDTTYRLDTDEHLMLTRHDAYISLSLPGYMTDGRGINLYLRPEQLPELRDAVAALEAIALRQDADAERDADAAPTSIMCPSCGQERRWELNVCLRCRAAVDCGCCDCEEPALVEIDLC